MSDTIGVIISGGFGAGWSTWGEDAQATDQELAQAISDKLPNKDIEAIAKKNWPDAYMGGLEGCYVEWLDKGTQFKITEYDGSEGIEYRDSDIWSTT